MPTPLAPRAAWHGTLRYTTEPPPNAPSLLPPAPRLPQLPPFRLRCPPPPDFQSLKPDWRPAGRVLTAAAGLTFVVALAITLTLALPQSDASANAADAPTPDRYADPPQQSGDNNGNDGNNPGNGEPEDEGDGEDGDRYDPSGPSQGGAVAAGAMAQAQAQAQSVFLNVSKVTKNTATLTIVGHTTAWYYKANAAPDNSCKGPVAANTSTKDLTALTANTGYTYTAYSDSGCNTSLAEATAFTTGPWLSVGSIGETTATLTITGHTGTWYYKSNVVPSGSTSATCHSVASNTASVNLTGLSAATRYIYGAYSDSACTTQLATAIGFKTLNGSLAECHDLALEMYINEINGRWYANYRVGNRADETLTNVKVVIQAAEAFQDGTTGSTYYTEDSIVYRNSGFPIVHNTDGAGSVWQVNADNGRADRSDWAGHWLMPTIAPAASHSVRTWLTKGVTPTQIIVTRNTVTMAQLADPDDETTARCKTKRVYWTRSSGNILDILEPWYGVALSADERYPTAGDTVNFKVGVNVRHSHAVNARVVHTPELELDTTSSVTLPAKTTWAYDAAKRQGDFWIGTENVLQYSEYDLTNYEITLPFQVQSGALVSEQCVTVTLTGVPGAGPRVFNQAGDDPSNNTATVCLGRPPLFQEDGDELALWSVYPCVGTTTQPCNSEDTLEVASVDTLGVALSAAPNQVNAVIKLDPVDGATVDTHAGGVHRYKDGNTWKSRPNKVSWVTKRTCPVNDHGHCESANHQLVPGVLIGLSFVPLNDRLSNWGKLGRLASVSGVGAGGLSGMSAQYGSSCATPHTNALPSNLPTLPPAPGGMMVRFISSGNWDLNFRPATSNGQLDTYPRHKRWNWSLTNRSNVSAMFGRFAEFEKLGTYVVDFHASASRATDTTHANPYCDTLQTVFHVGPVAELGVSDGGANPDLPSNQVAYRLVLANVGPDAALAAQALVELPAGATSVRTIPPITELSTPPPPWPACPTAPTGSGTSGSWTPPTPSGPTAVPKAAR